MKKWIAIAAVLMVAGLGAFTFTDVSADSSALGCDIGMPGC